jgi:hypothetical protein
VIGQTLIRQRFNKINNLVHFGEKNSTNVLMEEVRLTAILVLGMNQKSFCQKDFEIGIRVLSILFLKVVEIIIMVIAAQESGSL